MILPLPIEIKAKNVFFRIVSVVAGFLAILIAIPFYERESAIDGWLCIIFILIGLTLIISVYGTSAFTNSWTMPNTASLTITQQSIRFHSKPYKALGEIYWRDVAEFKEIAQGTRGRVFRFFVKDNAAYLNRMQSSSIQKKLKNICANNGGSLFFIESSKKYNAVDLKETFTHLIDINQ